ncbi:Dot/Icm type IV secretion system effector PhnB [soil metagenome]
MTVGHQPARYHTATPYLIVDGAAAAIDFYKQAFGAEELMRMDAPGGKVGHAEIRIGDSPIMLADEHPELGFRGPRALGGTPVSIMIYVRDVDAQFRNAIDAGAQEMKPLQDQFYGDRSGTLRDPFGHVWTVATHIEDVAPDEMQRRAESAMQPG